MLSSSPSNTRRKKLSSKLAIFLLQCIHFFDVHNAILKDFRQQHQKKKWIMIMWEIRRHMVNSIKIFHRINIQKKHIINFYLFFSGTAKGEWDCAHMYGCVCVFKWADTFLCALPNALLYNFNDYQKGERHALNLHEMVLEVLWGVFFEVVPSIRKITFIRLNKMCAHTMETIANRLIISKKPEKGMRRWWWWRRRWRRWWCWRWRRENRKMVIKR